MLVVEGDEVKLLHLKVAVEGIENKGDGHIVKGILFVSFAILKHVSKEILFVGKFSVVFKVVENIFIHFFIGAIFVVISSVALLPLEGEESLLTVCHFFPILASRHDLPDEVRVIASADIVFVGLWDGL